MPRKQTLAFPKLNTYSGTKTPGKGEVTFEAWRYEVKSLCVSHEESVVKEAMIRSLREPAAMVLRGLPTNASVKEILRHMEQRCDPTVDAHVMLKEFNNMTQGSKESAAAYITRLEAALHRICMKHPEEIGDNRAQVMLKRGCYQGLRDGLKESLRYLYDNPDLVEKVIQIDGEKNGRQNVLSKSGIMENMPKLSDTAGSLDTLSPVQELIKVLTAALQTDWKEITSGKGKLPNKQAGAGSAQLVPSLGNTQVKGRVDRASARCNKCSGIGHFARECPSDKYLNSIRGGRSGHPPKPRPAEPKPECPSVCAQDAGSGSTQFQPRGRGPHNSRDPQVSKGGKGEQKGKKGERGATQYGGNQKRLRHRKKREGGNLWNDKRVVISKGAQYHNPDAVTRLIGPRNIARVEINRVKTRALMDSRSQVNMMTEKFLETVGLTMRPLADLGLKLGVEGSAGTDIPYLGYTEANLRLPTANNYSSDQLFLVVEQHTMFGEQVPIQVGTNFQDKILAALPSARPGGVG